MKKDEKTVVLQELFLAYYEARKKKRNGKEVLLFHMNHERELIILRDEIIKRTYEISPSTCFIVERPVKREIFAGAFRDRIVHHFVHSYLNPLCEKTFIHDTYSCRIGKGTSYGIKRAEYFVRSVTRNYTRPCRVFRLDISGYFMSINKDILFQQVKDIMEKKRKYLSCDYEMLLWLIKKIIDNDPREKCRVRGEKKDWIGLPQNKSLFFTKPRCGLPIGNLTSQLFANVYLNEFDHRAKEMMRKLGGRYGRYVDDLLFVVPERKNIQKILIPMRSFLRENLGLEIHPRKIHIQPYEKGFAFLGRFILPFRTYIKRSTKGGMNTLLEKRTQEMNTSPTKEDYHKNKNRLLACWTSYMGIFMSCKSYILKEKLFSFVKNIEKKEIV
ncbi:MAG: hypothetical protein EOM19_04325 [Candidatus Moranbacteria bacterium]|nr:hypothetical protein [Candidatus Moranbacteria bacterium]